MNTYTNAYVRKSLLANLAILVISYTIFAAYCLSPWRHDPNAPQIYQMKLVDRYDASYQNNGKSKQWVVRYKGLWEEKETGQRLDLVIDEYMMYKMPIGDSLPMAFKPSTFGLAEDTDFVYKELPILWFGILFFVGLFVTFIRLT